VVEFGESLSSNDGNADVLAVIPSIGAPGFAAVAELQRKLESMESISCVVVSNSHRLTQYLESSSVPFVSDGINGGFGRSVQAGAGTDESWGWLLIVNDDISLDTETFTVALSKYLRDSSGLREIVYFDEDMPRPLPRRWEVFLQVSLIGKVLEKFWMPKVPESTSYRSFSCVAISRELYDLSDGFDDDLLFTYEDADFVARSRQFGAVQRAVVESGVIHSHSMSTGKHVDKVLPVATYSAARYLDKRGGSLALNSATILLALAVRLAFVPVTRTMKKKHVSGIYHSAMTVVRRSHMRPQLPHYSKL
jgi:GT2 family glycosyltransferase